MRNLIFISQNNSPGGLDQMNLEYLRVLSRDYSCKLLLNSDYLGFTNCVNVCKSQNLGEVIEYGGAATKAHLKLLDLVSRISRLFRILARQRTRFVVLSLGGFPTTLLSLIPVLVARFFFWRTVFVLVLHNDYHVNPSRISHIFIAHLQSLMCRMVFRTVIVVSVASLKSFDRPFIRRCNFEVLYNCASVSRGFDSNPVSKTIKGNHAGDKINVGLFGNYEWRKGHKVLFEAVAGLAEKQEFRLLLFGNKACGEFDQIFRHWTTEYEGTVEAEFHDFNFNKEYLFSQIDLLCVPSVCDESFGLVALEANFFGVPVIASDTGGLPEVLGDGKYGVLFRSECAEDLRDLLRRFSVSRTPFIERAVCGLANPLLAEGSFDSQLRGIFECVGHSEYSGFVFGKYVSWPLWGDFREFSRFSRKAVDWCTNFAWFRR